MAFDEKLADRIRESLSDTRGIVEKKMFGGIAFMLKDKMFIGIVKEELMVRMLSDREEEALENPHARPMDFTGKPMKGFAFIAADGFKSKKTLSYWIDMGIEYALKSPTKKKVQKK